MNKVTNEAPEEVLLTPAEVAKRLHVSPVTVRHWALQGKLPCITTPGGHRRFRPEDIERMASQPSVDTSSALRILIVDDDRQVATFLSEFVQTFVKDVMVVIANDGFEAAVQLHEHLPDLVLVDLMMPGMDGVSVCQRIKQHPQLQHTRVIGMTGYPTQENTERFCKAGAEAVLPKPLDTRKLRELIEQLSASRQP